MKPHTRIYFDSLGLYPEDFTPCELCGKEAVDIHHIEARKFGSTSNPEANSIFNLQALCRECHIEKGDKVAYKQELKTKHLKFIMQRGSRVMGIFQQVNFNAKKERGTEKIIESIEFIGE